MESNQILPNKNADLVKIRKKLIISSGILFLCLALLIIFNVPSIISSQLKPLLLPNKVDETSSQNAFGNLVSTSEPENPAVSVLCQESDYYSDDISWVSIINNIMFESRLELGYELEDVFTNISDSPYYDEVSKIESTDVENNIIEVSVLKSKIQGVEGSVRNLNFDCKYDDSHFIAFEEKVKPIKECSKSVLESGESSFLECVDPDGYISYKFCQDENGNQIISDCVFAYVLYVEE